MQSEGRKKKETNKTRKTFLLRGTKHTHHNALNNFITNRRNHNRIRKTDGAFRKQHSPQQRRERSKIKKEPFLHIF